MLGAIIGDICGSIYEFNPVRGKIDSFPIFTEDSFFTDDTILTADVAEALMSGAQNEEFKEVLAKLLRKSVIDYPDGGYGGRFGAWARSNQTAPYNSLGNGSAMRVSPVGWAFDNLDEVIKYARLSAEVTHNHPEGIKGAVAVASCIFLARLGKTRAEIKDYVKSTCHYDLDRNIAEIRENYSFDETCPGSVPEAIIAFLESSDFESAIRNAIWLRGDADTQAAIAGSIAEAFYKGVPANMASRALTYLDAHHKTVYSHWSEWLKEKGNL